MDVYREARRLFEENRRITDGHQYTVPSGDHYPYQWLWDSCFHAIVLARYDVEAAKAEIHSLLSKQFSSGLVPHIIYWTPGILHLFHWGTDGTSSLTQPPMLAYAAWEIHRREPDTSFLASIFHSSHTTIIFFPSATRTGIILRASSVRMSRARTTRRVLTFLSECRPPSRSKTISRSVRNLWTKTENAILTRGAACANSFG